MDLEARWELALRLAAGNTLPHVLLGEGNHSGYIVPDSEQMKSWTLPPEIEPVS
jgi:hypothetical protein